MLRYLCLLGLLSFLAACGGAGTAPVTDLSPVDKRQTFYVVKPGDTLHAISFRTGIAYQKLAKWNGIREPFLIYVGDKLILKSPPKPRVPRIAAPKPKPQPKPAAPAKRNPPASTQLASKPIPEAKLPSRVSSWQWPAKGKLTQTFSKRKRQYGIEIRGNRATPVLSAAPGQVVYAGNGIKGYGELVIVKHSSKFVSAYAYNEQILVREGQQVKAGQQIAKMGSSGTNGVKLHFEIRKDGEPVNPLRYLPLKSS